MSATASLRVCLVEDDPDTLESSSRLLRVLGYETLNVNSGAAALQQIPAWKPDVMLIDLAMPSLDGYELARRLRSQQSFRQTPLIAVSGYVDAKHRQAAAEAGFDEFLGKPYSLDDLKGLFDWVRTRILNTRLKVAQSQAACDRARALSRDSQVGFHRWDE